MAMTRKQRRMAMIGGGLALLLIATGLVGYALRDSIVFFFSPTEIAERAPGPDQRVRVGGLVETGSLVRGQGETVRFTVTDGGRSLRVAYTGVLPDLFREGQGVIAEGYLRGGVFQAETILAKHDENYMPKEVAEALKKQGHFRPQGGGAAPVEGGGS